MNKCSISDCDGEATQNAPIGKQTIPVCDKHYWVVTRFFSKSCGGGDV